MQPPSAQDCNNAERDVEVQNEAGLHMRPAMQLVDCASQFESQVSVCKGDQCVDGKSIMQIAMLTATKGTKLTIRASGSDAQQAVDAVVEFFNTIVDATD